MRRSIGKTGIEVFAIGLGAMPLSVADRPPSEEAIKVIHAALDAGVDFIDTANVYCLDNTDIGHNERLIARALFQWSGKKKIFVATKGGLSRPLGTWEIDGHPTKLRKACEQSLRDLNVEQIFLYQLHAPDDRVPFVEQIETLSRLQQEGKIKHIGISNVNAQQIEQAQQIVRIETIQNEYNPATQQDFQNGVLEACRHFDMTYIAYSPCGGGYFHKKLANDAVLISIAKKHKVSPYQVMIAWILQKEDFLLPIPGASRISSITDSIKSITLHLNASEMQSIDALSKKHLKS